MATGIITLADVERVEGTETGLFYALRNKMSGYANDSYKMLHKYDDGTIKKYVPEEDLLLYGQTGIAGPRGVTGYPGIGATGLRGTTGLQGATGLPGVTSATGLAGATGAQGHTGAQGTQGIQGITGLIGAQGIQGVTGLIGIQGIQGETGSQGATGVRGLTGLQGSQGITGLKGDVDNGFISVISNSTGNIIGSVATGTWYSLDDGLVNQLSSNLSLDALGNGTIYCSKDGYYRISFSVQISHNTTNASVYARLKHVTAGPTTAYYCECSDYPSNAQDARWLMGTVGLNLLNGDTLLLQVGNTNDSAITTIYYYSVSWDVTPWRMT